MSNQNKYRLGLFMIHGFSGSNEEFIDLEKFFSERGVKVRVPLLLGHGTTPDDLISRCPEDWLKQLQEELTKFEEGVENVYIGGISFGGNLAIHLAKNNPNIKGIFLLGTSIFFYFNRLIRLILPVLKYFKKYYQKRINPKHFFDPEALNRRKAYPVAPLKSMADVVKFISKNTMKELPLVKNPAMILHSAHDWAVRPRSATYIYNKIGSKIKELHWIQNSHHNLVIDKPREEVFQTMYNFMTKYSL